MNKEIKQKWIDALTSGEYKQGRNQLKKEKDGVTRYCCLGVLCELANKEGVGNWTQDNVGYDKTLGVLPVSVMNWAELKSEYGIPFNINNERDLCLTVLNDGGTSFEEIAKLIDIHL